VQGAVARSVAGPRHPQLAVPQMKAHVRVKLARQLTAGSSYRDVVPLDLYLHIR